MDAGHQRHFFQAGRGPISAAPMRTQSLPAAMASARSARHAKRQVAFPDDVGEGSEPEEELGRRRGAPEGSGGGNPP